MIQYNKNDTPEVHKTKQNIRANEIASLILAGVLLIGIIVVIVINKFGGF